MNTERPGKGSAKGEQIEGKLVWNTFIFIDLNDFLWILAPHPSISLSLAFSPKDAIQIGRMNMIYTQHGIAWRLSKARQPGFKPQLHYLLAM